MKRIIEPASLCIVYTFMENNDEHASGAPPGVFVATFVGPLPAGFQEFLFLRPLLNKRERLFRVDF
jgi:hypothetical protein